MNIQHPLLNQKGIITKNYPEYFVLSDFIEGGGLVFPAGEERVGNNASVDDGHVHVFHHASSSEEYVSTP
jgi:hypothetical protein